MAERVRGSDLTIKIGEEKIEAIQSPERRSLIAAEIDRFLAGLDRPANGKTRRLSNVEWVAGAATQAEMPRPKVAVTQQLELVMKWWIGPRRLSIYIGGDGTRVQFVKAWGPNVYTEMYDGEVHNLRQLYDLFEWVKGKGIASG